LAIGKKGLDWKFFLARNTIAFLKKQCMTKKSFIALINKQKKEKVINLNNLALITATIKTF
jgi:hypothetical protein